MHGNYRKESLRYGLFVGVMLIIVLLLRYLLGYKPSSPTTIADNITLLVMLVTSLLMYRNKLEDKKITFKEGFLLAFYSGIIGSILYGIFMYLYVNAIDTEMSLRCANTLRQIPDYADYSPQQFATMTKASTIALQSIIYNIVMSILWAFVAGLILRTEKSNIVSK